MSTTRSTCARAPEPPAGPRDEGDSPSHALGQHDVEVAPDVVVGAVRLTGAQVPGPAVERARIDRDHVGPFALQHVDERVVVDPAVADAAAGGSPRRRCLCSRAFSPRGMQVRGPGRPPPVVRPRDRPSSLPNRPPGERAWPRDRPRCHRPPRSIATPRNTSARGFHRNLAGPARLPGPEPDSRSSGSPYPPPPVV